ncbi:MAG TPA: hypothetical protein VK563_17530 [Puia sp.]|nr:hypothetical protein [Puia sp.]
MKRRIRLFFMGLSGSLFMTMQACSQASDAGRSPAPLVFVASTPCSAGTRPLPGIPAGAGCELMKWRLEIYGERGREESGGKGSSETGGRGREDSGGRVGQQSGTYVLDCDYGLPLQGTRGFVHGGMHLHREGKWIALKGRATNPAAIVYRLDPDKPQASVSFLRLNENLLHLLDSNGQLMIGTGAWSYTLNSIR